MSIEKQIAENQASIEELSRINGVLNTINGSDAYITIASHGTEVTSHAYNMSVDSLVRSPMAILRKRMETMTPELRAEVKALLVAEINAMEPLFEPQVPEVGPDVGAGDPQS